jgi:hypothetical protein
VAGTDGRRGDEEAADHHDHVDLDVDDQHEHHNQHHHVDHGAAHHHAADVDGP